MNAQQSSQRNTAADVTAAPRRNVLARHPLVGYFTLAYAGTWLTLLPVVLSKNGIGVLPFSIPFLIFALIFVASALLGPTLSAFIMTAVTEGRPGVRTLARRLIQWRVGVQWYLVTLFGFVAINLAAVTVALGASPLQAFAAKWPLLFTAFLPAVLTFNFVTAMGEEPGWRGFALPRLQERFGPLLGTLILGTLHAGWHLPIFFITALGFGSFTFGFFLTWIPAVWATSIIFTWMSNGAKGSILLAILMHSAADAAGSFVLTQIINVDGLGSVVAERVSIIEFVLLLAVALLLIVVTRGRLGYKRPAPQSTSDVTGTPQDAPALVASHS